MNKKVLAIITARGGSKRIPKKNIKSFFNKPMIAYAIEACLESKIFSELMVSTDSEEIANIAKKYGASVPFMRSEKNSDDFSTTYDVIEEVILEYQTLKKDFDIISCIYPCVPFLTEDIIKQAFQKFISSNCDSLIPVVKFSYPIQRAFKILDNTKLSYFYPEYKNTRSQDLEQAYHDVGMFYFARKDVLLKEKTFLCANNCFYEMEEMFVQDIDNESDWRMAELKYKILKEGKYEYI
jgi:pseudaminic acid cytidylyltransferase